MFATLAGQTPAKMAMRPTLRPQCFEQTAEAQRMTMRRLYRGNAMLLIRAEAFGQIDEVLQC